MLNEESIWIGNELINLERKGNLSPLLNFGSSTGHFRKVDQPVIYKNIFEPLEKSGAEVYHLDVKSDEGVDFIGNVFEDEMLFKKIKEKEIKTILCSNLLEHVPDRKPFFKILHDLLSNEGRLLITVPNLYPYHADPIDTGYRPTVEEILSEFPNGKLLKGEILSIDETYLTFLLKRPKLLLIVLIRIFTPFYKFKAWRRIIGDMPNLTKNFKVACVLIEFEKIATSNSK